MGGDDLGSDDEYLVKATSPVSDNNNDDDDDDLEMNKKRKRAADEYSEEKLRKKSPEQLLIVSGKGIEEQSVEEQVAFLNVALQQYNLLNTSSDDNLDILTVKEHNVQKPNGSTFSAKITSLIPIERLQGWDTTSSPGVIIITSSARRSVAILKEISDLKLKILKLFPKSGSVGIQCKQLQLGKGYSIAVGTPHRLLRLCEATQGLTFDKTALVVIDCALSSKDFTVCTLPDTAPHFAELVSKYILPAIDGVNSDLKLAFF